MDKADVIVIDTAHGHSSRVIEAIKEAKRRFPDVELAAGNIATEDGARDLIQAGVMDSSPYLSRGMVNVPPTETLWRGVNRKSTSTLGRCRETSGRAW